MQLPSLYQLFPSSADPLGSTGVWYRSVVTFPSSCPPLDAGMGPLMVNTASLPPLPICAAGQKMTKSTLSANLACPEIPRMCIFWKQKSPCGVAPNTEEGLRIYPNKINQFIQKSGKVGFSSKIQNLMEIYLSKLTFYRKPKWSVRSIRTTFMRYLSE